MDKQVVVCRRSFGELAHATTVGLIGLGIGIGVLYFWLKHNIHYPLLKVSLISLVGIIFPIIVFRQRIIAFDDRIEKRWIKTRSIAYSDIIRIEVYHGMVTLVSTDSLMVLSHSITNRVQLLKHIQVVVSARNDIVYKGDSRDLLEYFGKTPLR